MDSSSQVIRFYYDHLTDIPWTPEFVAYIRLLEAHEQLQKNYNKLSFENWLRRQHATGTEGDRQRITNALDPKYPRRWCL